MAIIVTENPLTRRLSLRAPWTASREFIVSGTSDEMTALTAIDGSTGTAVAQADEEHPANSRMRCLGPEVRDKKGIDYWVIGCDYEIPSAGNVTLGETDPLLEKPFVDWQPLQSAEPTDTDLDRRPIVNAAGDPIPGMSRTVTGFGFLVTRNEPYFDIFKARDYSMCVSETDVTIGGVLFAAGTLCLSLICPTQRYQFGARYVNIGYHFQCYPAGVLGKHPFQHRSLNVGDHGWYQGTGKTKGKFCNEAGEIVSGVRLTLTGQPIVSSGSVIKVGSSGAPQTPIDSPMPISFFDTEELFNGATSLGFAIYYKKVEVKDLSPILFGA